MINLRSCYCFLVPFSLLSTPSYAEEGVNFLVGTGFPYMINVEVAYQPEQSDQIWYLNAKGGLDYGFAVGFEQPVSQDKKHALGLFLGSIGVRDNEDDCPFDNENSFADALSCGFREIFDDESTNGLGATYSYNFNGLGNKGWKIRLEAGYGEGRESGESRADAGLIVSYQF